MQESMYPEFESGAYEINPEYLQPAYGAYETPYYEAPSGETSYFEGPLSEVDEMDLASELLAVTNEAEMDQFLGNLFRKAASFVGRIVRSPVGRALGGIVKGIARKALPMAGAALGSVVAPGVGTAIGGALGGAAGKMFGLELEGLSPEDQEFEVARRVVRLSAAAAQNAAAAPPTADPVVAAKNAVAAAAAQHAPGLLKPVSAADRGAGPFLPPSLSGARTGKWVRRGNKIVLFGI